MAFGWSPTGEYDDLSSNITELKGKSGKWKATSLSLITLYFYTNHFQFQREISIEKSI